MAVVAFDSATDRSVQDGQRTPASRAAARWLPEGGDEGRAPPPITSATIRIATGRATRNQRGNRGDRSATGRSTLLGPHRPHDTVELLLVRRPLEDLRDPARGIDDEGGRGAGDPVVLGDGATRVGDRRP